MTASAAIADRRARILVVDDEPDNRELLQLVLAWAGFVVLTAGSGEEALAAITEQAPDLVLLDIMMPGMSGYEVVARMKADVATRNIPVIMVTALEDANARARAADAGAVGFLRKPVDRTLLIARVRELLPKSRLGELDG